MQNSNTSDVLLLDFMYNYYVEYSLMFIYIHIFSYQTIQQSLTVVNNKRSMYVYK